LDQAGTDQRLRLRREGEAGCGIGIIKRLDAERIARQHQSPGAGIVDRQGIHAAERIGEREPVAAIELDRRFAVGRGREFLARELVAEFYKVINFAVRHQRRTARIEQRLVTGLEVDHRESGLGHADIIGAEPTFAVGAAMDQGVAHRLGGCHVGQPASRGHDAGDAAHQSATISNSSMYCSTTAGSENRAR